MGQIHLTTGEKGGVGKSWFCKVMIAYCLKHGISCDVFDADRTNANVLKAYGDIAGVKPAIFSEGEDFETAANAIFNAAVDGKRVLVNLPAQVLPALSAWIDNNQVFEMAQENQVEFISWFVSDGEADSIELFEKVLDRFDEEMTHVFVANYGRSKKWNMLTDNKPLMARMKQLKIELIRFPKFIGKDDRTRIDQLGLAFEEVYEHEAFDVFGRQHVRSFLKQAFAELDRVGLLTDE